jgi:hypothetical protein
MKITMQSRIHRAKHSHGLGHPQEKILTIDTKHRGRIQALQTLRAAVGPVARAGFVSAIEYFERFAAVAAVIARRVWTHSFETRVGVASALVFASALIGFGLGNQVIASGPRAAGDAIADTLGHAEHAFSLGGAGGVESMDGLSSADLMALEDGELVAQYAPVSIDALPVHDPASESVAPIGPVFVPRSEPLDESPKMAAPVSGSAVITVASTSDDLILVTRGEIARQESLAASLRRQGIAPAAVHLISTELRRVFDFRRSRAGDTYRLSQDADGRVLDFNYSQGLEESYSLTWKGTRYVASKQSEMLEPQIAKIAGVVDGSFYDAIMALGEQSALATEFAKILAWDMDFSRAVHPGDEFSILYERLYTKGPDGRGVYVRPGRILAGRYAGKSGEHTVVYYENGDGEGAYFRPDGSSAGSPRASPTPGGIPS